MAGLAGATLMEMFLQGDCSGNARIEAEFSEDTRVPKLGGYFNVTVKEEFTENRVLDWQVNQGVGGCQQRTEGVMDSFTTSCNPCEEQLIATVTVWNPRKRVEERLYFDLFDASGFCDPVKPDSTVPSVIGALAGTDSTVTTVVGVLAGVVLLAVIAVCVYRCFITKSGGDQETRVEDGLGPDVTEGPDHVENMLETPASGPPGSTDPLLSGAGSTEDFPQADGTNLMVCPNSSMEDRTGDMEDTLQADGINLMVCPNSSIEDRTGDMEDTLQAVSSGTPGLSHVVSMDDPLQRPGSLN